jgi:hypothetical protein
MNTCPHIFRSLATVNWGAWSESAERCLGCGEVRRTVKGCVPVPEPHTELSLAVMMENLKELAA